MKIFILPFIFALSGCMISEPFIANSKTVTTTVTWIQVDNIDSYCKEKLKLKFNPFIKYYACSVWTIDFKTCTIYTAKNLDETILGHELRHCFEGHFHP